MADSLRETLLGVRQRVAILGDSLYSPTREAAREILELIDAGIAEHLQANRASPRWNRRVNTLCACGKRARSRGMCNACYQRARIADIKRANWQPWGKATQR
jgi:hypothetical protein